MFELRDLSDLKTSVLELLEKHSRLTVDEVAKHLDREEELIKMIMQSMYVDQDITPLYVYEIGKTS